MALAPVVGAALTTPAARKWILTIGGLDVTIQPGGGSRYGIDPESIVLTEASCDGISSLAFTIDDPAGVLNFGERATVHLQDCVRDVPLFEGFLDRIERVQDGLARRHLVTCLGIEAVLDWIILPDTVTIARSDGGSPTLADAIQALIGQGLGVGVPLRGLAQAAGSGLQSDQPAPIADVSTLTVGTAAGDLALAGKTLRQGIVTCVLFTGVQLPPQLTVDFYSGIRVFTQSGYGGGYGGTVLLNNAADDAGLIVNGSTLAGARTKVGSNFSETIHQVYVQGGNAAGTGIVTDGSGIVGPIAVVSEPLSTTAAMKRAIGTGWLARRGALLYARTELEEQTNVGAAGAEKRAYAALSIDDTELGFHGATIAVLPIRSISKRFHSSGTEDWTIDAGAKLQGGSGFMRRLTPAAI